MSILDDQSIIMARADLVAEEYVKFDKRVDVFVDKIIELISSNRVKNEVVVDFFADLPNGNKYHYPYVMKDEPITSHDSAKRWIYDHIRIFQKQCSSYGVVGFCPSKTQIKVYARLPMGAIQL